MSHIVLLTTPEFITDETVCDSMQLIADRFHTQLTISAQIDDIQRLAIDLLFCLPGPFDAQVYARLEKLCPHIFFLAHLKTRHPLQRFAATLDTSWHKPDMGIALIPFLDPDELCHMIAQKCGWSYD